jgi:hypothetical protein
MSFTEEVVISNPSRGFVGSPEEHFEFPFASGAWEAKIDQSFS